MSSNPTPTPPRPKRPRASDDFDESLTCLVCCDYFHPPVVQCPKGHSYCTSCVLKMTRPDTSSSPPCAVCHAPIQGDIRNYALEHVLEQFFVSCKWTSCTESVSLYARDGHERTCAHRPLVPCYFTELKRCVWTGDAESLPMHLSNTHNVQELTRGSLFRYLWNPPTPQVWRYRYRLLHLCDSSAVYILEHFYNSDARICAFFVRSPDPDSKRKYRISIQDRTNLSNKIAFEGLTPSFADFGSITDYRKAETQLMTVALEDLMGLCFEHEDGTRYFSLHIQLL